MRKGSNLEEQVLKSRLNTALTERLKNALYLSVYVFGTIVLIRDIILTSPTGDGTTLLRGQQSHPEVQPLAVQFLSYFKTLNIGPAQGIKPATSRSAVKRSTELRKYCRGLMVLKAYDTNEVMNI